MTNLPLEDCVWHNGDCLLIIVWDGRRATAVLVMANNKAAAADDAMILRRQFLNPRVDQVLNKK